MSFGLKIIPVYYIFSTAICSLPKEAGPCRGNFIRWYYDTTMQKCLPFTYGGCRGNNNLFMSHEECFQLCVLKNIPEDADPSDGRIPQMNKKKGELPYLKKLNHEWVFKLNINIG